MNASDQPSHAASNNTLITEASDAILCYPVVAAFPLIRINDNARLGAMSTAIGNWMSVNEAATMLALTVGRIRQLLISGELAGKKLNEKAWVIERREIEKFARKTGKEIRPLAS